MAYLLDTGFLYAVLNQKERQHKLTASLLANLRQEVVLPVHAITEIAYLLKRDIGVEASASFVASLTTKSVTLECAQPADYQRAAELMRQYADAKLDFVDAIIVAIAERLNITQLLTLDQRDFRMIRPSHCNSFELLP